MTIYLFKVEVTCHHIIDVAKQKRQTIKRRERKCSISDHTPHTIITATVVKAATIIIIVHRHLICHLQHRRHSAYDGLYNINALVCLTTTLTMRVNEITRWPLHHTPTMRVTFLMRRYLITLLWWMSRLRALQLNRRVILP